MRIYHNIPALNAWRNATMINNQMSKSLERLSTGLRINRAADDAAGLAISEKMRAQVRGLNQAMRNAQDGISLIQTAEGGLNETHSILQRMRELSVQAANDTYTSEDRNEIQKEINQLVAEVDRIAGTTQFNKKLILNGDMSALVSSDKLDTKIFMRDGLRVLDQFGQKAPGGGNYKLEIEAEVGRNQVQKTDIFKIKHASEVESSQIVNEEFSDGRLALVRACVDAGAACQDDNSTLQVTISFGAGCEITVCQVGLTGFGAQQLCTLLNSNIELANRLCITTSNACIYIESKTPGEDFSITFTAVGGCATSCFSIGNDAVTAAGAGTISTCTVSTNNACYGCVSNNEIFTIQSTENITSTTLESTEMKEGTYGINTIRCAGGVGANWICGGFYSCTGVNLVDDVKVSFNCTDGNISLIVRVDSICAADCTAQISYMLNYGTRTGCTINDSSWSTMTVCTGSCNEILFGSGRGCIALCIEVANNIRAGDVSVINSSALTSGTCSVLELTCSNDNGSTFTCIANFVFEQNVADNNSFTLNLFQVDSLTGSYTNSELRLTTDTFLHHEDGAAVFSVENTITMDDSVIGTIANENTRLYDVDRFWDASGNFILETPQTLTLVQGNGKQTTISISGADTFGDVKDKLNDAIANGLGQKDLTAVGDDTDKFVEFVTDPCTSGFEALQGTFVIRSAIAGKEGEITFVGDDATINALSLTTIQNSKNNNFYVTVKEIHANKTVAECVKIATNLLEGVVHRNVDVQFSSATGVKVEWDDADKNWKFTGGAANKGETFVHLADRTMVLHIGANMKQDIGTGIGNMGKYALGIQNIQVTSNELANRAIGTIDRAIGMVSSERSKLGALQNRLEHTTNNLGVTMENITAAESRIRDADMAWEIMNFTKQQILLQSANAMLGQANQLPQNVLQLLR